MRQCVAFISQKNYESPLLDKAILRAIVFCGFDLSCVRGKTVLLKPNMLGAYPPDKGVTTHPAFVAALARIFKEAGATVLVGDSPNGVHPIERTWIMTGMREACRLSGAQEVHFEATGSIERRGVRIARAVCDADIVINLPKFKTHSLTVLTLATKNLFGCINGMQKSQYHRDNPNRRDFAAAIVSVADVVRPSLTLIDGIVAMEGNGPSSGNLVPLGVIAAGTDVHCLDAVCCSLIRFPPLELDTLAAAKSLGLWNDATYCDIVGDPIDELRPRQFALPATFVRGMRDWWTSRLILKWIWKNAWAKSVIKKPSCKRCHLCVNACPVSAILEKKSSSIPIIEHKKCIQCFCCHEVCPHNAIILKRSLGLRTIEWFTRSRERFLLKGETATIER